MQQNWSIRSRAHECALTGRPFEDGEIFHTAIYFDPAENGYVRRDVSREAWKDQVEKQKPVASWKTMYQKVMVEPKAEIAPKESAMELLQRFIEDGDPMTENARYILALMLERKRQIVQTAEKEVDGNKMLFYENKKTGEIFIVRDPELRLDEVAQIQEEVATILAFGGPAAAAAKAVGVTLTPDGVVPAPDKPEEGTPAAADDTTAAAESAPTASAETASGEQPPETPAGEPEAQEAPAEATAAEDPEPAADPAAWDDAVPADESEESDAVADPADDIDEPADKAALADDFEKVREGAESVEDTDEPADEESGTTDDDTFVHDIPEEGIAEDQSLDIRIGEASAQEEPSPKPEMAEEDLLSTREGVEKEFAPNADGKE